MPKKPKAIAIVGPTSSGMTRLSIKLAIDFNGEVVSADSRQVYRGLNLGTGKVTTEEMRGVRHHLLDITNTDHRYTAAQFEIDATTAIENIHARGKLPIIAGGTFFYLDLLRGLKQTSPVPPDEKYRTSLDDYSTEELFYKLQQLDASRADSIDKHNRPRLVRALEIINVLGHVPKATNQDSPYDWLVIGIDIEEVQLHKNIHKRLTDRFAAGMIEEVEKLHKQGLSFERMSELGLEYRLIAKYLQHELKHHELLEKMEVKNRQLAKRQKTWLRRDKEIVWLKPDNYEEIETRVKHFLHS